jgi:hypothetical protein
LLVAAVLAPAAQAAEPVDFSLDDGLTWRGDGWKATLGATVAVDGGEQVTGTGRTEDLVVRRLRPNLVVALSPQWSARVEYDFGDVGPGFKNAWLQWRPSSKLSVRLGSQFAPFGLENTMSSRTMPWTERTASSSLTAAALMVLVPALTVLTSWQRGVLVFFSRTGAITVATAINIVVLLAVVLGGVNVLPWPGAVTAALALSASLLAEVAYLTAQAHESRRLEAWA